MLAQRPIASGQPTAPVAAPAVGPAPIDRSPVFKGPHRTSKQHRDMADQVRRLPSPSQSRAPSSLRRQDSAACAEYHGVPRDPAMKVPSCSAACSSLP